MGSICCCFRVPDDEENTESNSSNCICPNCFLRNIINKYRALFGRMEMQAVPSFQGAASSSATLAPSNTQSNTGRHLSNDVNPQSSQLQNVSRLEPEPLERSNVQMIPKMFSIVDNQDGSEKFHSKSTGKDLLQKVEDGVEYSSAESEDFDFCPTCFEEYTPENPKIITKCCHHYHLGCIYEWMERSDKCPFCAKLMEFNETS